MRLGDLFDAAEQRVIRDVLNVAIRERHALAQGRSCRTTRDGASVYAKAAWEIRALRRLLEILDQ